MINHGNGIVKYDLPLGNFHYKKFPHLVKLISAICIQVSNSKSYVVESNYFSKVNYIFLLESIINYAIL